MSGYGQGIMMVHIRNSEDYVVSLIREQKFFYQVIINKEMYFMNITR